MTKQEHCYYGYQKNWMLFTFDDRKGSTQRNAGYNRKKKQLVEFCWEKGCWYFTFIEVRRYKNSWLLCGWGKLMTEYIFVASGYLQSVLKICSITYIHPSIINHRKTLISLVYNMLQSCSLSPFLLSQQKIPLPVITGWEYDSIRNKNHSGRQLTPHLEHFATSRQKE